MTDTTFVDGSTLTAADWFNDVNDLFYTAMGGVAGAGTLTKVQFPATQVASGDANALDDYEEGSATLGVAFGGGTTGITYSNQVARYTKVGNRVTVNGEFQLSNKGSSSGDATITGLPFALNATSGLFQVSAVWGNGLSTITGHLQGYASPSATTIALSYLGTGGITNLSQANFGNTSEIMVSISYVI